MELKRDSYDVVVVGAGIGGLTAAALLANKGLQVLLVDKNERAGGYAQSMERGGFTFDLAVHLISGCNEGGTVRSVLDDLDVLDEVEFMKPAIFYRCIFPDFRIDVSIGLKQFAEVHAREFPQEGQVLSASSTEGLCGRFLSGKGFALEMWAATDNPNQTGPARIVSYSLNPAERNFTLGQSKKKLIMRLRTTETDLNGVKPHVEVDNVFSFAEPQHIVVAYDFSEQRIFVNGQMRLRQRVPAGRFTNWDPSYYLVLGNEATGDRPWIGKDILSRTV